MICKRSKAILESIAESDRPKKGRVPFQLLPKIHSKSLMKKKGTELSLKNFNRVIFLSKSLVSLTPSNTFSPSFLSLFKTL